MNITNQLTILYYNICLMQPADRYIYERGCLRAGEEWLETHLLQVVGTAILAMILQVL